MERELAGTKGLGLLGSSCSQLHESLGRVRLGTLERKTHSTGPDQLKTSQSSIILLPYSTQFSITPHYRTWERHPRARDTPKRTV